MTEKEIFLKSHEELVTLLHWFSIPLFEIPRHSRIEITQLQEIGPGSIVLSDSGNDLRIINKLPQETTNKIIITFCESHLKLKND